MKLMIVTVYKSSIADEMYLYVEKAKGLDAAPDALREIFGTPIKVMDIPLTPTRKLGRVEASKLISELQEKGFYLQLPPPKEDYLLDLFKDTSWKYEDL